MHGNSLRALLGSKFATIWDHSLSPFAISSTYVGFLLTKRPSKQNTPILLLNLKVILTVLSFLKNSLASSGILTAAAFYGIILGFDSLTGTLILSIKVISLIVIFF